MTGAQARIDAVVGEKVAVRIVRPIGEGGMGTVYAAQSTSTGLPYAVKILLPRLCHEESALRRFFREAMTASNIRHPGVVSVVDFGRLDDGSAYYIMELLEGEDLARTLRREGRLPWPRVRHMALQICDAMGVVHAHGIVHRDLKPANCFRTVRGPDSDALTILDFGVAKIAQHDASTLTGDGAFLGTLPYMAPELLQPQGARDADPRGDLWASAILLHELLTGERPFRAESVFQLFATILSQEPAPLSASGIVMDWPEGLQAVLSRALTKDPDRRYPDMNAFAVALRELGDPPRPGRSTPAEAPIDPLGVTERPAEAARTVTATSVKEPAESDTARLVDRLRMRADFFLDPRSRWRSAEEVFPLPGGGSMEVIRNDLCLTNADAIICGITREGPIAGSLARRLCEFGGPEVAAIVGALPSLGEGEVHFVRAGRLTASYVLFAVLPARRPSPGRARVLIDQIVGACLERSGRPPIHSLAAPLNLFEALGIPAKECLEVLARTFSRHLEASPPFTLSMLRVVVDDGGARLARAGGSLVVALPAPLAAEHEQLQRMILGHYSSPARLAEAIAASLPSRVRPPAYTYGSSWSLLRHSDGGRLPERLFDELPVGPRTLGDAGLGDGEILELVLHDYGLPRRDEPDDDDSLETVEPARGRLAFVDWTEATAGALGRIGFLCEAYESFAPLLHQIWAMFPEPHRPPPLSYGQRWVLRERGRARVLAVGGASERLDALGFVPGAEFEVLLLDPGRG
ncbi:MAG: serine/threonine-protein kinase [Nannocystaceae bacterium]